MEFYR